MKNTSDVVIIGAGVIGCSTAYHLAKLGLTDVVVLEMESVASGTTSKSASMLSLQFSDDALLARMAMYSYERYMVFEEEIRTPIDFRKIGWVSVATKNAVDQLHEHVRILESLDIATHILTHAELQELCPQLRTDDVELATWGAEDGPIDAHMITTGYMKRARQMGVRLLEGVRATNVLVEGGSVGGVMTTEGPIATRVVINAGGPWAAEIGNWVDIDIPLRNAARTVVVTGTTPEIPRHHPFVKDLAAEWYFRPEGDGVLMATGQRSVEGVDDQLDFEMVDVNIEVAVHRVPILEQADMLTAWTGVRPLTPDGRPIVGAVNNVEGLILNCGWGGMGIIQSPVAGQLVAELVVDGRAVTFGLEEMGLGRFRT
jgi:glycine/D-amino acid oxidase-like deaminating enzyme